MVAGLCAGGTGGGVIDVSPMGMAVVPIFESLEWGRGRPETCQVWDSCHHCP